MFEEKFNRIVLIGNGFDIANELPTAYKDFLLYLFQKDVKSVLDNKETISNPFYTISYNDLIQHQKIDWKEITKDFDTLFSKLGDNLKGVDRYNIQISIVFNIYFGSLFNKKNLESNWTNIEELYHGLLENSYKTHRKRDNIKELNLLFEEIKDLFKIYLKEVVEPRIQEQKFSIHQKLITELATDVDHSTYNRFFKPIQHFENYNSEYLKLHRTKYINFNYTSCFKKYFNNINLTSKVKLVHIHGEVDTDIIFGYGDDKKPIYKEIEENGDSDFLQHSKAFSYPFSIDYRDLMNDIEQMEYEVVVLGHSLGLSDRIMLKTIFEHQNCKAIRLFHRGNKENWQKKYRTLSTHFDDKASMRNKIVEYNPNEIFN